MFGFLVVIHILVSITMIIFILLQDPKGGGALGMLGGGGSSKSLFGSTGANQFLINVTKWSAIIFAITSIALATLSSQSDKSIMDDYIPQATSQEKSDATTSDTIDDTKQDTITTQESPSTTENKESTDDVKVKNDNQ